MLKDHRGELETIYIPDKIVVAYQDTLKAFAVCAYLLTAVGFRMVIEAICFSPGIKVKEFEDLKPQIRKLQDRKLITKREADWFHTIRLQGNDSAHAIQIPPMKDLFVVLTIVEHLLNTLYVIDRQIGGKLERMVNDFPHFRTLLNKCINQFDLNDNLTLNKLLGKDARLIGNNGDALEKELVD